MTYENLELEEQSDAVLAFIETHLDSKMYSIELIDYQDVELRNGQINAAITWDCEECDFPNVRIEVKDFSFDEGLDSIFESECHDTKRALKKDIRETVWERNHHQTDCWGFITYVDIDNPSEESIAELLYDIDRTFGQISTTPKRPAGFWDDTCKELYKKFKKKEWK
jgi:hypothetical protein